MCVLLLGNLSLGVYLKFLHSLFMPKKYFFFYNSLCDISLFCSSFKTKEKNWLVFSLLFHLTHLPVFFVRTHTYTHTRNLLSYTKRKMENNAKEKLCGLLRLNRNFSLLLIFHCKMRFLFFLLN